MTLQPDWEAVARSPTGMAERVEGVFVSFSLLSKGRSEIFSKTGVRLGPLKDSIRVEGCSPARAR